MTTVYAISVLFNLICILWNYEKKNYKSAILHGFVSGVCLMELIEDITK